MRFPWLRSRFWRWVMWGLFFIVGVSVLLVGIFRWASPPISAVMLWRTLEQGERQEYRWVPMDRISPYAALAVMAAEDQRFPDHSGFDLGEMEKAVKGFLGGGKLRGASTISQQVAKNLFLWDGRSFIRKGLEAWFTVLLELLWPKERILEMYLNIAEMGKGVFGIEAASQRFFRVSAAEVSRENAALVAAVLPNPHSRSVERLDSDLRNRQKWILKQMRQLGGLGFLENIRGN